MGRFAKEAEPTLKGDKVDLVAFLSAKRTGKNEAGEQVEKVGENGEIYENISNPLAEALNGATEVKDESGRVIGLETADIVAEVRQVNLSQKIEGSKDDQKFAMEYVGFRAKTVLGAMVLAGGKDDQSFEGEGEDKREQPSVTKYFNDGFKVLSNNSARARLVSILEGPDKAIERAIDQLVKAKGWSYEKAKARVTAMLAED